MTTSTMPIPAIKPTGRPALKGETMCGFDHDGFCYASTCYSSLPCTARDLETGQPRKWSPPEKASPPSPAPKSERIGRR